MQAVDAGRAGNRPVPGGLSLLTGPGAGELLIAAATAMGARVVSWRVRHVDHQPGRATTVGYWVRLCWRDGVTTEERFGATTAAVPEGTLVLDDGDQRVAVWRFPFDPHLPGLPHATDDAAVAGLLSRFGFGAARPRLEVRAYRPGSRGVIQVTGERGTLFLKVVRPVRVRRLHERHRTLRRVGVPVPPSLGYTDEGVVVLQALPGETLRAVLRSGAGPLPDAEDVLRLLDRLPASLAVGAPRRSWLDRVAYYADVLAAVLPEEGDRVRHLAEAITAGATAGPVVPVHGDLYDSQLLVQGGEIIGLLDIDTAGAGDRVDDLGCLLGHLSVLARAAPQQAAVIDGLGSAYLAAFARAVPDAVELRRRAAAVALALATGPHRVHQNGWRSATKRRLDVAESWLAGAPDPTRWPLPPALVHAYDGQID